MKVALRVRCTAVTNITGGVRATFAAVSSVARNPNKSFDTATSPTATISIDIKRADKLGAFVVGKVYDWRCAGLAPTGAQ